MPARKSISEAKMLLAVAAALSETIKVLGTYMRGTPAVTALSRYSAPAIRAVFLVEFMSCLLLFVTVA